jgi:hypothetical protein
MGKNKTIKSIGKIIGNIVVHKILVNKTNRPESLHHLQSEVSTYRDNVFGIAQEYNWNDSDKQEIFNESIRTFKNRIQKYSDIKYTIKEAEALIHETIDQFI